MSRDKYRHRRLDRMEMKALLRKANMKVRDFMFVTGRQFYQISDFLDGTDVAEKRAYTPTMADAMILELCARFPAMRDIMIAIANEYSQPPEGSDEAVIERRKK